MNGTSSGVDRLNNAYNSGQISESAYNAAMANLNASSTPQTSSSNGGTSSSSTSNHENSAYWSTQSVPTTSTSYPASSNGYVPTGNIQTVDYDEVRRAEAAREMKQIQDDYADLKQGEKQIGSKLDKFVVDGASIGKHTYRGEAAVSHSKVQLPTDTSEYTDAINSVADDLERTEELQRRVAEFDTKYGDLGINMDELGGIHSELGKKMEEAQGVMDELIGTREKVDEINQRQANLFGGSEPKTEYFEDGSKRVTIGNTQYNYAEDGKTLLSKVEINHDPGGYMEYDIRTTDNSKLADSVVRVYDEDKSKSVYQGDMKYNYSQDGRLLSTEKPTDNGFVRTNDIVAYEGSALNTGFYADLTPKVKKYFEDNKFYYDINKNSEYVYFMDNQDENYMKICGAIPFYSGNKIDAVFAWPGEGDRDWTYLDPNGSYVEGMRSVINDVTTTTDGAMVVLSKYSQDRYDSVFNFAENITDVAGVDFGHVVTEGHSNGFAEATETAVKIAENHPKTDVTVCLLDSNPAASPNYQKYLENLAKLNGNDKVDFICTTTEGRLIENKYKEMLYLTNPVIYVNYNPKYSAYDMSYNGDAIIPDDKKVNHAIDLNHISDYAALALGSKDTNELHDGRNINEVFLLHTAPDGNRYLKPMDSLLLAEEASNENQSFMNEQNKINRYKLESGNDTNKGNSNRGTSGVTNIKLDTVRTEYDGRELYYFSQKGYYDENNNWVPSGWDGLVPDSAWGKLISQSGCSNSSSSAVISTLTGEMVTPNEIEALYKNSSANIGGNFASAVFPEYGLDYSANVAFNGKDESGELLRDNVLENGGAIIRSLGKDHYLSVLAIDNTGPEKMYFVADSADANGNYGEWVSESSNKFQKIVDPRANIPCVEGSSMTITVAPPGKTIEDILVNPNNIPQSL